MSKNIKFSDTDKTIPTTVHLFCIKIFLKAIPTRLQSLKFQEKKEKSKKKPYILNSFLPW